MRPWLAIVAVAFALFACGGGHGEASAPSPTSDGGPTTTGPASGTDGGPTTTAPESGTPDGEPPPSGGDSGTAIGPSAISSVNVFFTDLASGPNTGGEAVSGYAGAYVTLYGNGFGTSPGSVTLNGAPCMRVVAWGTTWLWYQKIVVQLGSMCTTGDIVVTTTAGSSVGVPFAVRGGKIFCVATGGSDMNTGHFPDQCWATMLNAKNTMAAGDTTYVEDGVSEQGTDDYDANLSIGSSGTATAPIALVAYPGAHATVGSSAAQVSFGVRTPNIGGFHYWVIAGLTVRSSNIGVEVSGGSSYVWAVGNDVSCPTAQGAFQGACMDTGTETNYVYYLGNYVHDNAEVSSDPSTETKGFHNMYFSSDSNDIWAAWNEINGDTGQNLCNGGACNACRGIQFHSSPVGAGTGYDMYDLHVHDNLIMNTHCDGINFATVDPSKGTVEAYNNVLIHTGTGVLNGDIGGFACVYIAGELNAGPAPSGTVQVFNNTCYDSASAPGSTDGAFAMNSSGTLTVNFQNNIVYALSGEMYVTSGSATTIASGSNNLFYGAGAGPSFLTGNVDADPMFTNAAMNDLHLAMGSPASGAGLKIPGLSTDFDGALRATPPSIGAYEH